MGLVFSLLQGSLLSCQSYVSCLFWRQTLSGPLQNLSLFLLQHETSGNSECDSVVRQLKGKAQCLFIISHKATLTVKG